MLPRMVLANDFTRTKALHRRLSSPPTTTTITKLYTQHTRVSKLSGRRPSTENFSKREEICNAAIVAQVLFKMILPLQSSVPLFSSASGVFFWQISPLDSPSKIKMRLVHYQQQTLDLT